METTNSRLRKGTAVRVKIGGSYYHGVIDKVYDDNYYLIVVNDNMMVTAHLNQLSPILQFTPEELASLAE